MFKKLIKWGDPQFDKDRLAAQKISSVIEIIHLLYNSISLTQIDHIKWSYWTYLNDATAASANLFDAQSAQIAETHSSCSRNKLNASYVFIWKKLHKFSWKYRNFPIFCHKMSTGRIILSWFKK